MLKDMPLGGRYQLLSPELLTAFGTFRTRGSHLDTTLGPRVRAHYPSSFYPPCDSFRFLTLPVSAGGGLAQGPSLPSSLSGFGHLVCTLTSGRGFQSRTTGSMPLVARKQ